MSASVTTDPATTGATGGTAIVYDKPKPPPPPPPTYMKYVLTDILISS